MSSDNSLRVDHVIPPMDGTPVGWGAVQSGTWTGTSDSSQPPITIELKAQAQDESRPSRKKSMPLNRKKRYKTGFGGEAEAQGVLSTTDVFGFYPEGQIGRMRIDSFLATGAILWAHNGDQLPIGRAVWLDWNGSEWAVGWKWAENEHAQAVKAEWDAGIIVAMSVGLSVSFDEDYIINDVALREASVVPVGADEGAVVASVDGPPKVLESFRAGLGVEDLTEISPNSIIRLAASLRSTSNVEKLKTETLKEAEMPEETQVPEAEAAVEQEQVAEPAAVEAEGAVAPVKVEASVEDQIEAATGVKVNVKVEPEAVQPWASGDNKPAIPATESVKPAEPVVVQAKSEDRIVLEATAKDLVPEGFDLEGSSDMAIKRAALSWEHENADKMPPIEVMEAWSALVQRRSAAMAGIAQASKVDEKAKQNWTARNEGQSAMVAKAKAEYLARLKNAHKRVGTSNGGM